MITNLKARQILDSRGNPTIEVSLYANQEIFTASVPSGASTGKHEAKELRDNNKAFHGKSVQKAIRNVNKILPLIKGLDPRRQGEIDALMMELDGTENKSKLGANAILAVSLAVARAGASYSNLYLFQHINKLYPSRRKMSLPRMFFNVINGGRHASNDLTIQEFMISPRGNFHSQLQSAAEIYQNLKKTTEGGVGDEGGFAPPISTTQEAFRLLTRACKGYQVDFAIDAAASEFYKGGYHIDGKMLNKKQLFNYYLKLITKYPIISIEDPFQQEDFNSFADLTKQSNIQIVGDDLTVTNPVRINKAIENGSCNCLLLKVNQIGTLTEALQAAALAYDNGWQVMVSHRSGETEDPFIADLAVGIGAMIKAGAPCRGERTAKYNQLLRISEVL
jgi:enolase